LDDGVEKIQPQGVFLVSIISLLVRDNVTVESVEQKNRATEENL